MIDEIQMDAGMSIGAHLISKRFTGLFHRAIIQSNPLATSFKTPSVGESKRGD